MEDDRCRGHCCHGFQLWDYEYATRRYNELLAMPEDERPESEEEFLFIYPMLIPLRLPVVSKTSRHPFYQLAEVQTASDWSLDPKNFGPDSPTTTYSCKNLQPNGDCGIYGQRRPKMCERYPNGRPCEFVDCGSKINKNWGASSPVGGRDFVPLEKFKDDAKWRARRVTLLQDIAALHGEDVAKADDVRGEAGPTIVVQVGQQQEEAEVRYVGGSSGSGSS